MLSRLFSIAISLSFLASALPLHGQQPTPKQTGEGQKQDDVLRIGTAAVQLEAIVTDKTGKRITGLTAADMIVLDEGVPQEVDLFSEIERSQVRQETSKSSSASSAANSGAPKTETTVSPLITPYQGHHIAIIVDDLNLTPENFLRTKRVLTDYIKNKLLPTDMMAIISTVGSLGSLQQFTNDKQRLLSALNRLGAQNTLAARIGQPRYHMSPAEAVRIDSGDTATLERVKLRVQIEEPDRPANTIATQIEPMTRGANMQRPENIEANTLDAQIRTTARGIVSQLNMITRANLSTMEALFKGMGDLPGRKVAVFLSESMLTLGGTSSELSSIIQRLIDIARRSGVSMYALDAAGLQSNSISATEYMTGNSLQQRNANPDLTFSDSERLGAVRALVIGTGGDLISNTNDLGTGLEKAIVDSSNYYVVGFKPRSLDNKFHHVTVAVKGKPDLIVRSRRGYLAINPETVRGTPAELLDALMRSPVPRIDLPLEVVANVVPKNGEQVVLVGVHLGRNYLTLPPADAGDQSVAFEVVSYVFAAGYDKPVGAVVRTVAYDLKNEPDARQKLKTEGFILVKEYTQLPPGYYQVRTVVREKATGAVGSAYEFFEIPELNKSKELSLSSLVLTVPGQPGFKGYNNFKRASEIELSYLIYDLPKDRAGLAQTVKLIDDQGRTLFDSALPISSQAVAANPAQFPQGTRINLPAVRGRYSLIVSVRDSKGKIDVERRADLVVE